MREIVIDGRAVRSMEDIHSRLKTELSFPHWYGNNLDALHDCLTELAGETCIEIFRPELLAETLGSGYVRLCRVLSDSAEENPYLQIQL